MWYIVNRKTQVLKLYDHEDFNEKF